jgi:hypothetical protein
MPRRTLSEAEFNAIKEGVLKHAPPGLSEKDWGIYSHRVFNEALIAAEQSPAPLEGSALSRATAGLWKHLNPATMVTGLYEAVKTPEAFRQTVANLGNAQLAQFGKAYEDLKQGHGWEAAGHTVAGVLPVLGPAAAAVGERIAETGDIATGVGEGLGLAGSVVVPGAAVKVAKTVGSLPIVPRIGSATPAVNDAVQFGLREGVPVDVATATDSRFLRGTQRLAEESMLGSGIGAKARAAQADALTATGERLAGRTHPTAVTAEQAGQAVRDAVSGRATRYAAAADAAYGRLRALLAKTPIDVDVAATKQALQPIYEALKREAELVPFISGSQKGRAYVMLDRLMQAPDVAPLSVADAALGELKGLARVDDAFRRTAGQGIAAEAVTNLEQAVRTAARQGGPDVFRALMEGRAATVNKFKTIDVLDQLATEPVGVFNQATWAKDAGIARLRELARVAPQEMAHIGRAWLENALAKATAEGGFGRAQGLLADWQKLGPQTKQLLFRDAAHIKDLDHFFLLAKKLAENPNPSGSALTMFKGGELAGLLSFSGPGAAYTLSMPVLAKLLLSPKTTRFLLQGARLPVGATAARTLWGQRLAALLAQQDQTAGPPVALVPQTTQQ